MAADSNMGSYQANLPPSFHHPLMVSFQSGARNSSRGLSPDEVCSLGGNNSMVGMFNSLGSGLINHMDATTSVQYSAGSMLREPVPGFTHVSGSPAYWLQEEIEILHIGLIKYSHLVGIRKYTMISFMLPKKTIRDVALRCQWITHKENGKRQKTKEFHTARKAKDMQDKIGGAPSAANISRAPRLLSGNRMKIQDIIPSEAPSLERILDENDKVMDEIVKNINRGTLEENVNIFRYVKNNISIVNDRISAMSSTLDKFPGSMRQMPTLQVFVNDELLASLIHRTGNVTGLAPPRKSYRLDATSIRPNIGGFREHT
ncbi:uncharacterized protein LOC122029959 [Zingiber officinale]|uniref:uncharacterized protein LOC121971358 n=2 Tax=Zingiber officinale TaxID=94328 RepID=UPI001C4AD0AE|nr:uncharacterized protein LOC121971358 [Zingiber officinale]XP_042445032.1 uncharacterized protein LOC122029949 [Zingiber officinale]XP_042445039.1 uncharacterized protein LOC122029959 [Zingiber officinale]